MDRVAKAEQDRLKDIKRKVEQSHGWFRQNYERFHEFTKFVCKTSLDEQERETLSEVGKPQLEFNILESLVSRLRGQFAKQQPSVTARLQDGIPAEKITEQLRKEVEVVESHLRAVFFDSNSGKMEYDIYTDLLRGGFSVAEIYTDYISESSFEQKICVDRVFDPTLCGFDPMAREAHKGDGRYCFQLFPMTRSEFEREYGKARAEKAKFTTDLAGFSWSYKNESEEVILVCDFYEKRKKKEKIYKLTNGDVKNKRDYDQFLKEWEERGNIEQPPLIVSERWSTRTSIVRYRLCECDVLSFKETSYSQLPLVFFDGDSATINEGGSQYQMTRPYVYHAKGVQQLKNFAGQTLAAEIENMVMHKFIVAEEAIPPDYVDAYQNVQEASTLVYNHLYEQDPSVVLPPPREIQRTPTPPEVTNAFRMSDEMTQVILGTYDNQSGINRSEISGAAIAMGAIESNNAAIPYIMGYIKGLNRVAEIIVDLIPKYYRTPRTLPILKKNGERTFETINQYGSLYFNYNPSDLLVKVETGVNFSMQKEIALKTIISLMQSSERFAQFINDKGLHALLDNIDIRGIDDLKAKAIEWEKESEDSSQQMQQMQQMQQQMQVMQQQMMQSLAQAEVQKAEAEAAKAANEANAPTSSEVALYKNQVDAEIKRVELEQEQEKIDLKAAEAHAKLQMADVETKLKIAEIDAEQARTDVENLHTMVQAADLQRKIDEE